MSDDVKFPRFVRRMRFQDDWKNRSWGGTAGAGRGFLSGDRSAQG